jgi:hypothetical protein
MHNLKLILLIISQLGFEIRNRIEEGWKFIKEQFNN